MVESGTLPTMEAFTTVPLAQGSKVPACKWRHLNPGESVPDRWGTAGRAVLTGHRSGGLVVLDVDVKDGGFERLAQLETSIGDLPPTRTVRTPSGGLHLYYTHPLKFRSVARVAIPAVPIVKGVDGVDVRAEGGIVVLPGCPRGYQVEADLPIAELPASWATVLPKASREPGGPSEPIVYVQADQSELRQRMGETSKARRGDGWKAIRAAVEGERMISIQGGPSGAVLVHGVDEFLSKSVVFALCSAELDGFAWYQVPAQDAATLFAPSLSILRQDVQGLGGESKWTPEHFAEKWARAAEKVSGEVAELRQSALNFDQTKEEAQARSDAGAPLICQIDNAFFVLDDRDRLVYQGPIAGSNVGGICSKVWGTERPLIIEGKTGPRAMSAQEIREAYGTSCMELVVEYAAHEPRVDDLQIVNCLPKAPVEPQRDPEVEAWLELLGGPSLLDWIAWAAPEKCASTVPALALIGGSHVGKSLLAAGLAQAAGQSVTNDLKRVLGRFRSELARGPIVFGDEGLPSIEGKPATEEFRAIVTNPVHSVELKGLDKRQEIRGGVRVILAANRAERLFSNAGNLGGHDIQAITRRLFVVDVEGDTKISRLVSMARELGAPSELRDEHGALPEGDPARVLRVAQHIRHVQLTRTCPQPSPRPGSIDIVLRTGSDSSRAIFQTLEDLEGLDWHGKSGPILWTQLDKLQASIDARFPGVVRSSGALARALGPYTTQQPTRTRKSPITDQETEKRMRWTGLDLTKLRADGIEV